MTTNNKISNIVASQLPFFVRNDHPNFVLFMEAYYEYLEQTGKPVDVLKNAMTYNDVDETISQFMNILQKEYLNLIPTTVKADKALLIKNIKDFYRAKGSEKAVKFLLNILFNGKETELYYPKQDILRASDGKWYVKKTLKIKDFTVNGVANSDVTVLSNFVNKLVYGDESGASAVVEALETYYERGYLVNEIEVTNQKKQFKFSETISTTFPDAYGANVTIRANIYSGIVSSVKLRSGGKNYERGAIVQVDSNTGSGAIIRIEEVTEGGINAVVTNASVIWATGAGFQVGDGMTITGGGGVGANANVISVSTNGRYHPNSYSLVISLISDEANTQIGNARYSNCNSAIIDPANSYIANSMLYWNYSNCGPFEGARVTVPGVRYSTPPTADLRANSRVRALGILGRMYIVDGGSGYQANDKILFDNVPGSGSAGGGAKANVITVNGTGAIMNVWWERVPGYHVGGQGYNQSALPRANIQTVSGTGANVIVTALIGDGESLIGETTTIGEIKKLTLINGGSGYETAPTINLKTQGSGTAQATANIITGVYAYEGRYLNDDGHLSGFNFLQDKDYYQQYSYVVRLDTALNKYRRAILDLIHPAGMKLFGEFLYEDNAQTTSPFSMITYQLFTSNTTVQRYDQRYISTSVANTTNLKINMTNHGLLKNAAVLLEFTSNVMSGIEDYYKVQGTGNANVFFVTYEANTGVSNTGNVYVYK